MSIKKQILKELDKILTQRQKVYEKKCEEIDLKAEADKVNLRQSIVEEFLGKIV